MDGWKTYQAGPALFSFHVSLKRKFNGNPFYHKIYHEVSRKYNKLFDNINLITSKLSCVQSIIIICKLKVGQIKSLLKQFKTNICPDYFNLCNVTLLYFINTRQVSLSGVFPIYSKHPVKV